MFILQGVLKVRKRVTKMVLTVSIIYALCWLPNLSVYALAYLSPSQTYGTVLYITSIVLVTCNSAVNPFIYVFVNQTFREKLKICFAVGRLAVQIEWNHPLLEVSTLTLLPITVKLIPT